MITKFEVQKINNLLINNKLHTLFILLLLFIFNLSTLQLSAQSLTGTWSGAASATNSSSTAGPVNVAMQISTLANGASFSSTPTGAFNTTNFWSNASVTGQPSFEASYGWGSGSGTGTITFTFNRPVNNPILHIDRLGGLGDDNRTNSALFTLTSSGLSLTKLAGVNHFNVTSNTIYRTTGTNVYYNGYSSESSTDSRAGTAAGSVQVNGTNISSVSFTWSLAGGQIGSGDELEMIWELNAPVDLGISQVINKSNPIPGQSLTYTLTITNNGSSSIIPSDHFTLTDALPSGFTATSFTPSAGTYNSSTGDWTGVSLASGQSVTLAITGNVTALSGSLSNSATVTVPSGITDPVITNNTSILTTSITTLLVSPTVTPVSSPCASDGAATVAVSGGSGNYTYNWAPTGGTAATATGLSPGFYYVTVTDITYGTSKVLKVEIPTSYNNTCAGKDGNVTYSGASYVNTYYPPSSTNVSLSAGATSISLGTAVGSTAFAAGDLALIIQMQGANMTSTNTSDYGTVSSITAGKYEYCKVQSYAGGVLTLTTGLKNSYANIPASRQTFQIIRVPQYNSLTLGSNIVSYPWNGSVGGVVALDVAGTLSMGGYNISADAAGFRGGAGISATSAGGSYPFTDDWVFAAGAAGHGYKGEGIAGAPDQVYNGTGVVTLTTGLYATGYKGMGAAGNAGGGANDGNTANAENSGGGGGSNLTTGGKGGNTWNSGLAIGGNGGYALSGSAVQVYMGGGGGSGSANDNDYAHGGNGGGIVFVNAKTITGTGNITANGHDGYELPSTTGTDAGGGGGGGGTIVVTADTYSGSLTLKANGGKGSDCAYGSGLPNHGPGGGGSGGAVYTNINPTIQIAGGANGVTGSTSSAYGASSGTSGLMVKINKNELTNSVFGSDCRSDLTAPTISCPSAFSVCAGNVPAAYATIAAFQNAGGTAVDAESGLSCITSTQTGSEASGSIVRTYKIADAAGNYSTCSQTITVNPLPTASISGTATVCQNTTPPAITFTGNGGTAPYTFTYTVNSGSNQTVTTTSGNSVTVSQLTGTAGTFTYTLVSVKDASSTTCSNTASGSAVITVNAIPTAYSVTGGGSYCSGGSGVSIGLSGSQSGVNYQLQLNGANSGASVAGTGSAISFGNQISAGTYTVTATNTTTGCLTGMTGSIALAINSLPSSPTVSSAMVSNACPATTVNIASLISSSTPSGCSILYKTTNDPAGTDVTDPTKVGAGTYYIFYKNASGCSSFPATPVTVTIHSCNDLSITKAVSDMNPLVGTDVTFTITAYNGSNDMVTATEVKVTDKLLPNYVFKSSTVTTGTYDNTSGIWTIGNLAPKSSAILTITATVK
ncbi:DUF11 domain-containing protein [Paludibacter sp.]|uniref:DUF11 domain-containing protein n=1 Tax=Paludibacter sp. TaxID=1898105 RepID=UPI001354D086|nr:DUF11 domain-containing protein [Paludibacter sp.]MTK53694.1 DUF11 domain-containing protein [Paludibacter sp.]